MAQSNSIVAMASSLLLCATGIAGAAVGDTELVSARLPDQKTALDESRDSRISGDGRFVVFSSRSADLVAGDDNLQRDVFIRDLQAGTIERVSVTSSGGQANTDCPNEAFAYSLGVSGDGRFVVFSCEANNLVAGDTNGQDIFVRDRQTGQIERVNLGPAGMQSNGSGANFPAISSSGRFVVFSSDASNLIAEGDLNGFYDIYLRDRQTGQTELVSTSSSGAPANNFSIQSSVSADGRYVAFDGYASNLVTGDTNGVPDVFVHDRQTGQTQRVSVGTGGVQANGASSTPMISANGRYVTFASGATNLVAGDTNATIDIFVRDLQTGETLRVNLSSSGAQAARLRASVDPSISADGRFVAFYSQAANLVPGDTNNVADFFVRDRQTGQTQRVSLNSAGVQQNNGPDVSSGSALASVSSDGRYVAFGSNATNLVAGDYNGQIDVFVRDRQAATTSLVTASKVPSSTASGPSTVGPHGVSGDGRYVAFTSNAPNLISGSFGEDTSFGRSTGVFLRDRGSDSTALLSVDSSGNPGDGSSYGAAITPDGRFVAFSSNATNLVASNANDATDTYVRDRQTGLTEKVSLSSAGIEGNLGSDGDDVSISADGRYVAFGSLASNLVAGDTNDVVDIFVRDRQTGQTERVNVSSSGTEANPESINASPAISADGRYVAFVSSAMALVTPAPNSGNQVYVHDRQSGQTTLASGAMDGAQLLGGSGQPSISSSGRFVAFVSGSPNLVPGDTNARSDIFVRDRQSGQTQRVSVDSNGVQANGTSEAPAISPDGRFVAFNSSASNLVVGDRNRQPDVFVHDRQTGTTELLSSSSAGVQGNGDSFAPAISANARFVAFNSLATNLVTGDLNEGQDIFIRERAGAGTGTSFTLTPASRDFGSHPINTSTARTFSLTNTGSGVLAIQGVRIIGTNAAAFSQANNCGSALAAAALCTITVTFRTTSVGSKTAALEVTAGGSVVTRPLSATATSTSPTFNLVPRDVDFAAQARNTTSAPVVITVNNTGTQVVPILSVATQGPDANQFHVSHNCGTLPAGASCQISVTFRPTSVGDKSASLAVVGGNGAGTRTARLTGWGT